MLFSGAVSPNKGHIRLLTYNIFLRPPFIRNNADDYKNERFEEFLNHLDNYDVIALQEMFSLVIYRQFSKINYDLSINR
jgi:hypothetical protein